MISQLSVSYKIAVYAICFNVCVIIRIVLLNRIVHLNTMNRIVRNWTITSFKIRHSPDFRKPGCSKKIIWFDPFCPISKLNLVRTALHFLKLLITSYPYTMHFKSYSPLKYFIHVSTKSSSLLKALVFSLFSSQAVFFLCLDHFK